MAQPGQQFVVQRPAIGQLSQLSDICADRLHARFCAHDSCLGIIAKANIAIDQKLENQCEVMSGIGREDDVICHALRACGSLR